MIDEKRTELLKNILKIAVSQIGVKEIPGEEDNPRIIEYDTYTTLKATDDETPWCSSFVNWVMAKAGVERTNSAAARSWLNWGEHIMEPLPGCIVILKRGAPPSGHVCLYVAPAGKGLIQCLGGNQGDQVKISVFKTADVLAYRIPKDKDEQNA